MTGARLTTTLRKHAKTLQALQRVSDRVRVEVIANAKKELVEALVQCAKAIINRQTPLTRHQSEAIRRRARDISDLVRPGNTLSQKRAVLQRGGLLGTLLRIVPSLLGVGGGLLGLGQRRQLPDKFEQWQHLCLV